MPYLYLVRHAQPDFTGNYDSVTALGVQQAAWLGQHFAARGLRFARVVSGSLQRQVQQLRINRFDLILVVLPMSKPATTTAIGPEVCSRSARPKLPITSAYVMRIST